MEKGEGGGGVVSTCRGVLRVGQATKDRLSRAVEERRAICGHQGQSITSNYNQLQSITSHQGQSITSSGTEWH